MANALDGMPPITQRTSLDAVSLASCHLLALYPYLLQLVVDVWQLQTGHPAALRLILDGKVTCTSLKDASCTRDPGEAAGKVLDAGHVSCMRAYCLPFGFSDILVS